MYQPPSYTSQAVVWLDLLSAKARYSAWLNGVLPTLVPWTSIFHARGAGAAKQRARVESGSDSGSGLSVIGVADGSDKVGEEEEDEQAGGVVRYAVRLRGLRHPLLLGDYLKVCVLCVCVLLWCVLQLHAFECIAPQGTDAPSELLIHVHLSPFCLNTQEKERLERALRQAGGDPAMVQAVSRTAGGSSAGG